MVFIETSIFTNKIKKVLSDDEYKQLQSELMLRPEAGVVIKGSGGLRKLRWKLSGTGKRGGIRLIYYFDRTDTIYMIFVYKKTELDDLSSGQLKLLRKLMKESLL